LITNQRKINTSVMAQDGETIVLGGLVKDDVQESVQKVPLLGDIPLLGRLFRSNATTLTKTNLLVFIRPTIIRTSDVLRGATAEKYGKIRSAQIQEREDGVNSIDDSSLPLLPEWQDQLKSLQQQAEQGQQ
jgi:general secretion pathway protein D